MKFSTAALSTALLIGSATAAPGTARRSARAEARQQQNAQKRANRQFNSNPLFAVNTTTPAAQIYGPDEAHVSYSSNWAGTVLVGSGYKSVTAEVTVPKPAVPSGGSSGTQYCASAWVGIDGDTCETAILQTGFDACIQDGSASYDAWYEWYPDYAYDFSGISIAAGNTIKMTVTATSKSAGSAVLENVSTGQTVTHSFSSESNELCETNAEWIVEDFESGSSLVPFANFGTITFSDAYATTSSGTTGAASGSVIDIQQNGQTLTSVSTSGADGIVVKYV